MPAKPSPPTKANPRRANGHRRDVVRSRVLARGEPCWICGLPIDPGLRNPDPLSAVVDELVPVSRGGSPTDPANCVAAHRCCNGWRGAKPVPTVRAVQARVSAMGGATDPSTWCAMARRAIAAIRAGLSASEAPRTSTDW